MKILRSIGILVVPLALVACASPQQEASQSELEQRACAAVGLDQSGGQFRQCVADLDSNLDQSHPGHD